MQNTNDRIFFNFSYFALKLLGKGLYSNPWTAIAELVANGIDAQASNVKIYINMCNKKNSTIEIFDNGSGMDYEDLAAKYVLIGKNKRADSEIDEETRKQLMGRKGIGKLAALYLSNKYYLVSKTIEESSAWCLDMSGVNDSDIPQLNRIELENTRIVCSKEWSTFETGTMIRLGTVQAGFEQVDAPHILCSVNGDLPNEYRFTNKTDVGGSSAGDASDTSSAERRSSEDEWVTAKDGWVTIIYAKPRGKLPQTGR